MKITIRIIITLKACQCVKERGGGGREREKGINIARFYVEKLAGNFLQLL